MKNILNKFLNLLHINKKITLQKAIDDNLTIITIIYPQTINNLPTIYQITDFVNKIEVHFYKIKLHDFFVTLTDQEDETKPSKVLFYSKKDFKKFTSIKSENIFVTTTKKEALNFINKLLNPYKEYLKIYLNKPQNNDYYDLVKQIKHKIYEITMKIYGIHVQ